MKFSNVRNVPGKLIFTIKYSYDTSKITLMPNGDVYMNVQVPITTMVFGGDFIFEDFCNEKLKIKIPERTKTSKIMRLEKKGVQQIEGYLQKVGNLFITLYPFIPDVLSEEALEVFEKLKSFKELNTEIEEKKEELEEEKNIEE
jgi:DnaJ-class molecular chaperone